MTHSVVIKNALIVNEGTIKESDLRIRGRYIDCISSEINASQGDQIIEARGQYLLPGMIDDQVHFREPGLTHKGTIASESRAAVAGGITSYMEMPNVNPATTSIDALENKFVIAAQSSMANYSFYLGATENNLDQIKLLNPQKHCGVKVFMGASTGDLLVENPKALDAIFCESPVLIVTHCESSPIIQQNLAKISRSGRIPTILDHPIIRDTAACFASSSYAVSLAKKYRSQLHVLHITTEKELSLFETGTIEGKHITAEACVHHLWFSDQDYQRLGNLIKCNPSIKSSKDRDALIKALHTNQIDIIATDHAPHTLEEKQQDYNQAPAGLPLVEHALLSLLEAVKDKRLSIELVIEKIAHNPAKRYAINNRGFIREGYYADLVLVDMNQTTTVSNKNTHYHCGWTPFHNHQFSSSIQSTWVNGQQVFNGQQVIQQPVPSKRLTFNR
ncbi:dihydroorotase [Candidatus Njordibacter sp. Uisw_056]|jgi:dihydroorotase|uniref:dihydroorotase n=1 Tax=Candidatus Njordibacter sp. Uisw_056 TaxID=3230973 RepID=UPI003D541AD2|tara:strand:+ start:2167 stop:3504 length:1338 start_codon:yes stop_codon:yes gene_type:complete